MEENASAAVTPPQTFSEHRAARSAAANPPAPAATSDDTSRAAEQSETAGKSASPPKEPQKQDKPRNARNAEERAADLRAAGRHKEADDIIAKDAKQKEFEAWEAGKADRERDAEELRTLRAKAATPPPAPASPVSRETPAAQPSADPTRPKLKDFLAKPENKEVEYAEVVEQWKDADDAWKDSKRAAKEAQSKQAATAQEKMTTARGKYADFDKVLTIPIATTDNLLAMLHDVPNGLDALYFVASDPKELARIQALSSSPRLQLIELGHIARNLASNGTVQTPEKPKAAPPVSRTPPPPRHLGGIAPKEESKGIPRTLSEHKAARANGRAS